MLYFSLVNKKVLKWEESIACICLFLIAFLVFFAALLRLVGIPQAWMSDLSQLLFGWVIFLGSDLALSHKRHIGVEFFEEKLPDSWRKTISNVWSIFIVSFLGFVAYFGWFLAQRSRREFDSLMISEFNLILFLVISLILLVIFDFVRNGKQYIKVYLGLITLLIAALLVLLVSLDLSRVSEPLSYAFLIASVPAGCVLMIRTECAHMVNRWSNNNV